MLSCQVCGVSTQVPGDVEEGELVECSACGAEYEVTGVEPLTFMLFEEDEK